MTQDTCECTSVRALARKTTWWEPVAIKCDTNTRERDNHGDEEEVENMTEGAIKCPVKAKSATKWGLVLQTGELETN